MTTSSTPDPPKTYTAEAKALWREIAGGWALDPPAVKILGIACESLMRRREAQAVLAREGLTVLDRFKQRKAHPATTIERDSATTFLAALRALHLDLEPLRDHVGRPPSLTVVS